MTIVGHTVLGDAGAPTTIVCHPGGPCLPGTYFGDLAGLASDRVRVVQVHPRGTHGTPPPADGDYALERYADDLDELREHLGLQRLDLLGHSHGGFVAMTYAAHHPDRLGRLVLVCTAPRFSDELRAEMAAALDAKRSWHGFAAATRAEETRRAYAFETSEELAALYAQTLPLMLADPEGPAVALLLASIGRPDPAATRWFNERIAPDYDMRPVLTGITSPTLVLNGALDGFGPRAGARELAAIPGARIRILDDVGHFPFLEDPVAFAAELGDFLGL